MFVDSIVRSNATGTPKAAWLEITGLIVLAFTVLYDHFTLKVARWEQIVISVIGVGVYIFTVGGWFATTTWYRSWYSSIAVAVFAIAVGMINLPDLPTTPASGAAAPAVPAGPAIVTTGTTPPAARPPASNHARANR